jgi:hypothetical protein
VADTLAAYLPGPVTIDRAEAWRRVAASVVGGGRGLSIGMEDTPYAYVAWLVEAPYPEGSAESGVLLVDKHSGRMTRWPAFAVEELGERYRRYINGEPFR